MNQAIDSNVFEVTYARFETLREKVIGDDFRHNHEWYRINGSNDGKIVAIKIEYRKGAKTPNTPPYFFVERA